jgi:hypothetical protein
MNPADEMAAKIEPTEGQSADAVAGSNDQIEEQLRATLKELQRNQSKLAEDLQSHLLRISHHLDYESSERKAIHDRLRAIDNQTKRTPESQAKRRGSRAFVRYLVAICVGVAATLAWQSYGETAKQIVATRAPELGWSPEVKQMIASGIQQLGWTKPAAGPESTAVRSSVPAAPQAAPVAQTAPENVAPKAPAAPSLDAEQVHQIALNVAALRQTVEQLTAVQNQMARAVARQEAALVDILVKMPERPPQSR